jgi:hypothetical protein
MKSFIGYAVEIDGLHGVITHVTADNKAVEITLRNGNIAFVLASNVRLKVYDRA